MIKTFVKRPEEVQAIQYVCNIDTVKTIREFGGGVIGPITKGNSFSGRQLSLDTPEGRRVLVNEGDYIIKSNGIVYSRPKQTFEQNYMEGSLMDLNSCNESSKHILELNTILLGLFLKHYKNNVWVSSQESENPSLFYVCFDVADKSFITSIPITYKELFKDVPKKEQNNLESYRDFKEILQYFL